MEKIFKDIIGFEWDQGNVTKNWDKHKVSSAESEEVFFNQPLIITVDEKHSLRSEIRYYALGKTTENRRLFIVFTIRNNKIRVISARSMSRREKEIYDEEETKHRSS